MRRGCPTNCVERQNQRVRRAAAAVRNAGGTAIAAALAQIDTAFDETAAINRFKIRVERMLRLATDDPALRARFGAPCRAADMGATSTPRS